MEKEGSVIIRGRTKSFPIWCSLKDKEVDND